MERGPRLGRAFATLARGAAIPAVALFALPLTAQPLHAGTLVPHRAVYDLALGEASDRMGITGISGRMVYEFAGSACDGYTVTFRYVTRIETPDLSRLTDQQTTTFEEGDGSGFNFVTRVFIDSALDSEVKGRAELSPDATLVSIEKPDQREVELEATQFPTMHLLELLEKAQGGETFYETSLFDGSEDADEVLTTTVIIGRPASSRSDDPELETLGDLADESFWPVDMAYFEVDEAQGDEIPVYRISYKLYENGVTRDLIMDYGYFAMTGRLVDLVLFDAPADCPQE